MYLLFVGNFFPIVQIIYAEKKKFVRSRKKKVCQKWDSNPRPQKWTATWTQRLRPLGHPDLLVGMSTLSVQTLWVISTKIEWGSTIFLKYNLLIKYIDNVLKS